MPAERSSLQESRRWNRSHVFVTLVLMATAGLYARTARFEFVRYDDDVHVYENEHVIGGLNLANVAWAFGIHGPSQWHPLAWLSHQLDCELFGRNPAGHHLVSLALHLLSTVLLYLALRELTRQSARGAFVAALFALHPLNVESVAWVSERRNVLCAVFWMATLWSYGRYARLGGWRRYLLVCLWFGLAIASKPLAVTLPCVLLLLDFWPLNRRDVHSIVTTQPAKKESSKSASQEQLSPSLFQLLAEKVPLLVISLIAGILTILCQQSADVIGNFEMFPIGTRVENALVAYALYLQKAIWPVGLAIFYPHPAMIVSSSPAELRIHAIGSAALLIAVTIVAIVQWRRRPYLLVGWLWFLGVMAPMSGLFQVGEQQLADRYAYLPLIGVFIAVVWGIADALERLRSPIVRAMLAVIVCVPASAMSVLTWNQLDHWRDTESLFSHAIAVTEHNYLAHNNLGYEYYRQGNLREAAVQYALALEARPMYALAHFNLGVIWHETGYLDHAERSLQSALRLHPEFVSARVRLAAVYVDQDRMDEALAELRRSSEMAPDYVDAHFNRGLLLQHLGLEKEAADAFRRVLEVDPDHERARAILFPGSRKSSSSSP